ncbi:PAS domain S-box protein [Variovorax sp. RHLX14]|uniref:PAS domain S-box protein n=1 Tax=Variovorax sp. RHLX14 TaxID=1259731 RepID=UPI003F447003
MWHISPDLLLIIGLQGFFRRVNPAWIVLLGYAPDELVDHHVNEFVVPEDHDQTVDTYTKTAAGEMPRVVNRYRHKDDLMRWIAARPLGSRDTLMFVMYGRRHLHRCTTAFFVVLALLFSQLALAGYVCPGTSDAESMTEMVAIGMPCEGMDTAQPVLCFQHAADLSLSYEPVKLATPSLPAIVQVVVMPLVLVSDGHAFPPQAVPERQHPPPDPVFLATHRLRV